LLSKASRANSSSVHRINHDHVRCSIIVRLEPNSTNSKALLSLHPCLFQPFFNDCCMGTYMTFSSYRGYLSSKLNVHLANLNIQHSNNSYHLLVPICHPIPSSTIAILRFMLFKPSSSSSTSTHLRFAKKDLRGNSIPNSSTASKLSVIM
jgi:hypothetical protein